MAKCIEDLPIINGMAYQVGNGHEVALVYLCGEGKWGLMALMGHMVHDMTAPIFRADESGKWMFTEEEVRQQLEAATPIDCKLMLVYKDDKTVQLLKRAADSLQDYCAAANGDMNDGLATEIYKYIGE